MKLNEIKLLEDQGQIKQLLKALEWEVSEDYGTFMADIDPSNPNEDAYEGWASSLADEDKVKNIMVKLIPLVGEDRAFDALDNIMTRIHTNI